MRLRRPADRLIDEVLPTVLFDFLQLVFFLLAIVLLVSILNPWIFLLTVPLAVVFYYVRRYYMKTAREVKRLEGVARSPVYGHFTSSLSGAETIRSHGASGRFIETFERLQNEHGRAYMSFVFMSRWVGFRLDMMTFIFVTTSAFAAVASEGRLAPGDIGLSLMYAIQMTASFQWCVRQVNQARCCLRCACGVAWILQTRMVGPLLTRTCAAYRARNWRIFLHLLNVCSSMAIFPLSRTSCTHPRKLTKYNIIIGVCLPLHAVLSVPLVRPQIARKLVVAHSREFACRP